MKLSQTKLKEEYVQDANKADAVHTHTESDITDLGTYLTASDITGKADKTNVLELDNTTEFTPDADYEPATKKYVDDNSGSSSFSGDLDDIDEGTTNKHLTTTLKSNYDTGYSHSQATHAPSDAQKNSDITKEEIEAKLTGEISSHSHAGSSESLIILTKSSAANQNVGGANNTEVWWTWNGEDIKSSDFTHNNVTNSERIYINTAGWYAIRFVGNVQQTGSARTTLQGILRVNGGTTQRKGTIRDYARGSSYGNCSPGLDCIIELAEYDYIEVGTKVEDTDATYTLSTNDAEIADDENLLIVRKINV